MDNNFASTGGRRQSYKWVIVAIIVLAAIAIACHLVYKKLGHSLVAGVDSSYQAVFLSNGQVYFGKLSSEGHWIVLKDIYYLQVTQQLQPAPNADQTQQPNNQQPNIQLVKLGSELHGPKDSMYIDRDKILFWENMKDDSKVVQAIQKYQGSN